MYNTSRCSAMRERNQRYGSLGASRPQALRACGALPLVLRRFAVGTCCRAHGARSQPAGAEHARSPQTPTAPHPTAVNQLGAPSLQHPGPISGLFPPPAAAAPPPGAPPPNAVLSARAKLWLQQRLEKLQAAAESILYHYYNSRSPTTDLPLFLCAYVGTMLLLAAAQHYTLDAPGVSFWQDLYRVRGPHIQ